MTIKDASEYAYNHSKYEDVFPSWSIFDIANGIRIAIDSNAFCWCYDNNHKIVGITIGKPDAEQKVMWIVGIIADNTTAFLNMLDFFLRKYPGWTLEGRRGYKGSIKYNPERIRKLVTAKHLNKATI